MNTTVPYRDYAGTAQYFGVSESLVRRWVRLGLLKPTRMGHRTVRFSEDELARFKAELEGAA